MDGYYVFSDECGSYQMKRSNKYIISHPFYVRASVIIDFDDYIKLENECGLLKEKHEINPNVEIKWSETGNRFNNRVSQGTEEISDAVLFKYIEDVVVFSSSRLDSMQLFFTVFDNRTNKEIDANKMLKMHLQNALQRANIVGGDKKAFMTFIMDDVGEKTNKLIKEVAHEMMEEGDFQEYHRIKKSILIDYSHHCVGLQLADFCAGIFTNCLKRLSNSDIGYDFANGLFFDYLYSKVRNMDNNIPFYSVYRYGIREVPNDCGIEICKRISKIIEEKMKADLEAMILGE